MMTSLVMNMSGYARVCSMKDVKDKDGFFKGVQVTLRYEGGMTDCLVPREMVTGIVIGDIVTVWIDVIPHDCGYQYQGRWISQPGWKFLNVIRMDKFVEEAN